MGDNTKFEFVMEKHQVQNLLAKYLNDPTHYDWNGNLTELKLKLQLLKVRFKIDLLSLLVHAIVYKTFKFDIAL